MESLILMAVIFFITSRITKSMKPKTQQKNQTQQAAQQTNNRQQQAIEEQRRRRAAYEEMLKQQEEEHNKQQMQRMFGDIENEKKAKAQAKAEAEAAAAKAEEEAYEPHHIDEEEEQRCIDAEALKRARRVSQKELKRELLQRFGGLEERQSIKPRPQSLSQAQKQLHMPVAAVQTVQMQQTTDRPRTRRWAEQEMTTENVGVQSLGMKSNTWAQGIVLAEILGPPRAKKRQIR